MELGRIADREAVRMLMVAGNSAVPAKCCACQVLCDRRPLWWRDLGRRPARKVERGARAVMESGSAWALDCTASSCSLWWVLCDVHILPIELSCGVWHWAWTICRVRSRMGHQKATKSYLALDGDKAPVLCFITWIPFSEEKGSDVRSDLVFWCFSQVLLQYYSCDTCRILSLICSNAQAAPPSCKCLLKIYELFTANSTLSGFSRICHAQ